MAKIREFKGLLNTNASRVTLHAMPVTKYIEVQINDFRICEMEPRF